MFELKFTTKGTAFDDPIPEMQRILRAAAQKLERVYHGSIQDANGNTIGEFHWTP